MIESCSKKRMIFAIAVMAGLSFLVIILESSQLRSNNEDFQDIHDTHPVLKEKLKEKDKCWLKETYSVTEECDVCTPEEVSTDGSKEDWTSSSVELCKMLMQMQLLLKSFYDHNQISYLSPKVVVILYHKRL